MRLLRDSVLIGKDAVLGHAARMLVQPIVAGGGCFVFAVHPLQSIDVDRVDGGHNGEVVLEFVKVRLGPGISAVQGVDELWIIRTKGQLVDVVAEVEGCVRLSVPEFPLSSVVGCYSPLWSRCCEYAMYPCPLAVIWKSPCTLLLCMLPYILQLSASSFLGVLGVY